MNESLEFSPAGCNSRLPLNVSQRNQVQELVEQATQRERRITRLEKEAIEAAHREGDLRHQIALLEGKATQRERLVGRQVAHAERRGHRQAAQGPRTEQQLPEQPPQPPAQRELKLDATGKNQIEDPNMSVEEGLKFANTVSSTKTERYLTSPASSQTQSNLTHRRNCQHYVDQQQLANPEQLQPEPPRPPTGTQSEPKPQSSILSEDQSPLTAKESIDNNRFERLEKVSPNNQGAKQQDTRDLTASSRTQSTLAHHRNVNNMLITIRCSVLRD